MALPSPLLYALKKSENSPKKVKLAGFIPSIWTECEMPFINAGAILFYCLRFGIKQTHTHKHSLIYRSTNILRASSVISVRVCVFSWVHIQWILSISPNIFRLCHLPIVCPTLFIETSPSNVYVCVHVLWAEKNASHVKLERTPSLRMSTVSVLFPFYPHFPFRHWIFYISSTACALPVPAIQQKYWIESIVKSGTSNSNECEKRLARLCRAKR